MCRLLRYSCIFSCLLASISLELDLMTSRVWLLPDVIGAFPRILTCVFSFIQILASDAPAVTPATNNINDKFGIFLILELVFVAGVIATLSLKSKPDGAMLLNEVAIETVGCVVFGVGSLITETLAAWVVYVEIPVLRHPWLNGQLVAIVGCSGW